MAMEAAVAYLQKGCSGVKAITFAFGFVEEIRAINFVRRLIADGRMERGAMKAVNIHMISDDDLMNELSAGSNLATTQHLVQRLKAAGQAAADRFLTAQGATLGQEGSGTDLRGLLG